MHLNRLTLILEIVSQKGRATVGDLCAHSDLPKPTAYRLVQDLVSAGLLDPVGRGQFALGARLRRITQSEYSDAALIDAIAPTLHRAAVDQGAAFFLSRLRGQAIEIIHVETPQSGVSYLHPGLGRRPLHACSCAKAIVAFSPDVAQMAGGGPLKAYTEQTVTCWDDLNAELAVIRTRGYAECIEELERGICSVAAPIAPTGPGAMLSVGATASTRVFKQAKRAQIGALLTGMAADLARAMGWTDEDPGRKSA